MNYRGIDIYNGSGQVDFVTAKAAGMQFCIARCGYGQDLASQDDAQFQRSYEQCRGFGIPFGCYFYSYALTAAGAESEKGHLKRLLAGKNLELPVFVDMEDADGYKSRNGGIPDRQTNTDIARELCEFILSLGYRAGYYCNKDWAENHLYPDQLTKYLFWYARPGVSEPDKPCYLWQDQIDSTGGHFPGVRGDEVGKCDTDVLLAELPAKVPQFPTEPVKPATYTVQSGDTLSGIAAKYGTTYQTLAALNGIADPNVIYPGQVLRVTGSAPAVPTIPTVPTTPAKPTTYTVQSGDTLSGIAAKYGTTYQALAALNGISNPNVIYPGQLLRVTGSAPSAPAAPAKPATYTVQSGDTLSGIAAKYGTTYQALAALNGIANPNVIYPGQLLRVTGSAPSAPATPAKPATYTVQSGDTLSGIAAKYGTTYQALAALNGIANPNVIYPGQVLRLTR